MRNRGKERMWRVMERKVTPLLAEIDRLARVAADDRMLDYDDADLDEIFGEILRRLDDARHSLRVREYHPQRPGFLVPERVREEA